MGNKDIEIRIDLNQIVVKFEGEEAKIATGDDLMQLVGEVLWYGKVLYTNGLKWNYIHCTGCSMKNENEELKSVEDLRTEMIKQQEEMRKQPEKQDDAAWWIEYVEKNNIAIDEVEKINVSLLHGKIGAHIAKTLYDVSEQIQKAIEYHTETSPNMDELAKIIYVSDKIERNRKSEKFDLDAERELARKDLDGAVLFIIDTSIEKLVKKEKLMHPTIVKTRNKLLMERM